MNTEIKKYNGRLSPADKAIGNALMKLIEKGMKGAECKVWHGHPVWFIEGNPIVGYSSLKDGVRLMFWSGQTFKADGLQATGKFKAAEARYTSVSEINERQIARWLKEAHNIQWDYKNIVKRKGALIRLV